MLANTAARSAEFMILALAFPLERLLRQSAAARPAAGNAQRNLVRPIVPRDDCAQGFPTGLDVANIVAQLRSLGARASGASHNVWEQALNVQPCLAFANATMRHQTRKVGLLLAFARGARFFRDARWPLYERRAHRLDGQNIRVQAEDVAS